MRSLPTRALRDGHNLLSPVSTHYRRTISPHLFSALDLPLVDIAACMQSYGYIMTTTDKLTIDLTRQERKKKAVGPSSEAIMQ